MRKILFFTMLLLFLVAAIRSYAQTYFSEANTINDNADGASSVFTIDLDLDGDIDVLSTSYNDNKVNWYENDGNGNFTIHLIDNTRVGPVDVFAADLNYDHYIDIVVAYLEENSIIEYLNDGSEQFSPISISDSAHAPISVYCADLDRNDFNDIIFAELLGDKIAWYKNIDGDHREYHIISTDVLKPHCVHAANLTNDIDVISASYEDDKVAWYNNDGTGSFGAQQIISNTADGATSVYAADLNRDGLKDVISTNNQENKIVWFENLGDGSFGSSQTIYYELDSKPSDVCAGDINQDGLIDVISSEYNADKISWHKNDGTGDFYTYTVAEHIDGTKSVAIGDIDGDGDLDIVVAASNADAILWFENYTLKILSQPQDVTVSECNTTATFSVVAKDASSYQWQVNNGEGFTNISDDSHYSGSNTNTLTISNLSSDFNGNLYRCVVSNLAGEQISNAATITIEDTEAPIITSTMTEINLYKDENCQAILPDLTGSVSVSDNCDNSPTISQNPPPGSIISENTPIVITATDDANNSSSYTINAITIDPIPPIITSDLTETTIYKNQNCETIVPDLREYVSAWDNCENVSISQYPPPGCSLSGGYGDTTTISFIATDEDGNTDTCQIRAFIADSTRPVIYSNLTELLLYKDENCEAILPNLIDSVSISDNCDDNLTITQNPEQGSTITNNTTVYITASDQSGNTANYTINVLTADTIKPIINCPHDTTINLQQNVNQYIITNTLFDATAEDNCSINQIYNSLNNSQSLQGAELPIGETTIIWYAYDQDGNVDSCNFTITVNQSTLIETTNNGNIQIYPNPTEGIFTIKTTNNYNIYITNVSGKIIFNGQINAQKPTNINLKNYKAGVYILHFYNGEETQTLKLIKK